MDSGCIEGAVIVLYTSRCLNLVRRLKNECGNVSPRSLAFGSVLGGVSQ